MNNLTLASRFARAVAVLACVLAQWWPVATYAGSSPPAEVAATTTATTAGAATTAGVGEIGMAPARPLDGADEGQGNSCRPLRGLGRVTIQRYDCAP